MSNLYIGYKSIICIVNIVYVAKHVIWRKIKHKACGETLILHTLLKYYNGYTTLDLY